MDFLHSGASASSHHAVRLLVGTKKGGFMVTSDASRTSWKLSEPLFLGNYVHHFQGDPRAPERLLLAAKAGHLGHTIFRSEDGGKSWKEVSRPPAFPAAVEGGRKRSVHHVFRLTPGHASEPGVWYCGTSPQGLFRSDDHGETWESVAGFNDAPENPSWVGRPEDVPPDGATLHSISVDPRDPQHLYLGMSGGGVFESRDRGASWKPLNRGVEMNFAPPQELEYGHDPHCLEIHPLQPDRLYHQNHCGIYRMDRAEGRWTRIGNNMPKEIGDIGFPVVLHPADVNTLWVFPMDGTDVWPRTSPGGRPAVYCSRDAGESWIRQDQGLPERAWFTVYRLAMTSDREHTVGVYFGTTNGEIWGSRDEGASWYSVVAHLPHVYSLECAPEPI